MQNAPLKFSARLSIPYRTGRYGQNILYRLAIQYTQPPRFVPEKIPAVPALYRPRIGRYIKIFFFFFFFLSFVIFEFLLGQNGNLLVLFVFLVCNGNF